MYGATAGVALGSTNSKREIAPTHFSIKDKQRVVMPYLRGSLQTGVKYETSLFAATKDRDYQRTALAPLCFGLWFRSDSVCQRCPAVRIVGNSQCHFDACHKKSPKASSLCVGLGRHHRTQTAYEGLWRRDFALFRARIYWHHEVHVGRTRPHHIRAIRLNYCGYALEHGWIRGDNHQMRPFDDPFVVCCR